MKVVPPKYKEGTHSTMLAACYIEGQNEWSSERTLFFAFGMKLRSSLALAFLFALEKFAFDANSCTWLFFLLKDHSKRCRYLKEISLLLMMKRGSRSLHFLYPYFLCFRLLSFRCTDRSLSYRLISWMRSSSRERKMRARSEKWVAWLLRSLLSSLSQWGSVQETSLMSITSCLIPFLHQGGVLHHRTLVIEFWKSSVIVLSNTYYYT